MLAVMYHYIRKRTDRPPFGYYHLKKEQFRRQLDYFEDNYHILTCSEFAKRLQGDVTTSENELILTFDDGLRCHREHVLPELRDRNLWGMFFIPIQPIRDRIPLHVHQIHNLLAQVKHRYLHDQLTEILEQWDLPVEQEIQVYDDQTSQTDTKEVKRLLNFGIRPAEVNSVLTELQEKIGNVSPANVVDVYMQLDDLKALRQAGMTLGAHGVTHHALTRLSRDTQRLEINNSIEWLNTEIGEQTITSFAYPYGTPQTFDKDIKRILQDADIDVAFTTVRGEISSEILTKDVLALPRRDCNEFKYGESSATFP